MSKISGASREFWPFEVNCAVKALFEEKRCVCSCLFLEYAESFIVGLF